MVFSNLLFIYLFLPACLGIYYLGKDIKWRNAVLIFFSLLFYSFGEPVWVLLLLGSSLVDYCCGLFIEKHRDEKKAVLGIVFSLIINLGVLCIFKYSGFIIESINSLFNLSLYVPSFRLPIGISFYTFQTISYTADVYKNKAKVQHDYMSFLLYVSMFFQLVAGPIVRYTDVDREISHRQASPRDMFSGFSLFIFGLGKKVIIANCVGGIADSFLLFDEKPDSVLAAWSGLILFSLQIYFDFSGYSDMAVGLGRMFGFHLPRNFDYPYISKSASEFWRRWHISLGSFFRDYVYIPMGGNRRHQLLNLAVVWFLTGLWHGASVNFILWGLYFGVLVTAEKYLARLTKFRLPAFVSHIYLLAAVLFGWALFYYEDLSMLGSCLGGMFGGVPMWDEVTVSQLKGSCFVIAAALLFCMPVGRIASDKLISAREGSPAAAAWSVTAESIVMLAVLAAVSLLLVKQSYNPFLYFRY